MNFDLLNFSERAKNFWFTILKITGVFFFFFSAITSIVFWAFIYVFYEPLRTTALPVLQVVQVVWGLFVISLLLFAAFFYMRKIVFLYRLNKIKVMESQVQENQKSKRKKLK